MRRGSAANHWNSSAKQIARQPGVLALLLIAGLVCTAAAPVLAGSVYAWGNGEYGQLGSGVFYTTPPYGSPTPVATLGINNVRAIAGGGYHSLALKTDGTVQAWGINGDGELGDGAFSGTFPYGSSVPVEVIGVSNVTAIAGGGIHSLALKTDGTVWAWGGNTYSQLGNGTLENSSMPAEVSGLSNVTAIAGGDQHSLALKADGTVWAWGDDRAGELGNGINGPTAYSSVPVEVSGLSNVAAIAGGGYYSLALKTDGTVWAWGGNDLGVLGDAPITESSVPVEVSGLSKVTAIAAGAYHNLALRTDGTVWAWGDNRLGELGDRTFSTTAPYGSGVPVEVSGLSNITAIACGGAHCLALKTDGTVWAWGGNVSGELGNGTTTNSSVPVEVSGLSNVTAIAGGGGHSLAMVSDITAPTTTDSLSGPAGQNGWYTGPITVTLSATDPDDPSGSLVTYYTLDGGAQQTYTAPFTVSGDGKHTLSFFSEDPAGNHEAPQSLNVLIDSTPPTLSFGTPSPAANAAGWNNSAVTIPFTTADNVSAVASSSPASPLQFTAEGKNQTQSVKVTDKAGNSATFTSPAVNIDLTPPVTTLSFSGPAGAGSSSFTGPVQVKLSATDNLSGVSSTFYTLDGKAQQTYTAPFTIAADGTHTIKYWSMDAAGNVETAHTQSALVDTSLPAITITSPQNQTYLLNQVVNASYSAADTTDGVVSLTGTVPSGSPIDTSSVGTKTFTVKASDTAGNSSEATVSYTVSYGVKLLYDPTIAASPGQPLAISLQLVDASGANVSSASITLQAVSITGASVPASPGTGSGPAFTFDPALAHTGGYDFNLSTRDLPAGALNLNFIAGNDPTVHQAPFTSAGPAATIPAGVSMVSVPFANSGDLASLFGVQLFPDGSADIATYDPVASQYLLYPHLPGMDGKSGLPGRGYWVEESSPTKVQSAISANPSPLDVSLSPGWNMIGDPYGASLSASSLQVALSTGVGSTPANQFISEPDAVTAGIVGGTIWGYDTTGRKYTAADTLTPFVGYWIYVNPVASGDQSVTLRFTQPGYQILSAGG